MAVLTYNWTWQQGEDLVMPFVYRAGPTGAEVPVDLTGYSVRMDVADGNLVVYTFNSDDLDGLTNDEAVLGSEGQVEITVDHNLTLEGGPFEPLIPEDGSVVLKYDLFLRNTAGKQKKIMRGTITIESSITKWE